MQTNVNHNISAKLQVSQTLFSQAVQKAHEVIVKLFLVPRDVDPGMPDAKYGQVPPVGNTVQEWAGRDSRAIIADETGQDQGPRDGVCTNTALLCCGE